MFTQTSSEDLSIGEDFEIGYTEVAECPHCHKGIKPNLISSILTNKQTDSAGAITSFTFSTFNYCNSCYHMYLVEYTVVPAQKHEPYDFVEDSCDYIGPSDFQGKVFESYINEISPSFVSIYNQALRAESLELPDICGMAYRKALEFLIKDYAMTQNTDEHDKIKPMPLSQCIKTYIDNPIIQDLAKSATWLGNDETHYTRKHIDKDLSDLKKFIEATQYFICMKSVASDAKSFVSP